MMALHLLCYMMARCSLEKAMAPHSSALDWKIPWAEEPGRLQSMGSLKVMSFELAMLANYLILYRLLLLWPSIFPSIRVFSNELPFCIRWPKIGASASASPSNERHLQRPLY